MSMNASFRTLSDADLTRLRSSPDIVEDYVLGIEDDPEDDEGDGSDDDGCGKPPRVPPGFGAFMDLHVGKVWHAIHFLLTGSAWGGDAPLNFVAVGGSEVGDDLGYGPPRAFTSDQVSAIAKALEPLPREVLLSRFDAEAFRGAEIYPHIWDRTDEDHPGWIGPYYERVREFIIDAAKHHRAMLVWLT